MEQSIPHDLSSRVIMYEENEYEPKRRIIINYRYILIFLDCINFYFDSRFPIHIWTYYPFSAVASRITYSIKKNTKLETLIKIQSEIISKAGVMLLLWYSGISVDCSYLNTTLDGPIGPKVIRSSRLYSRFDKLISAVYSSACS